MRWWQDDENQERSLNGTQQAWLTGMGMMKSDEVGPEPWEKIEEGIHKYYDNLIAKSGRHYNVWEKYKLRRQRDEAVEEAYDRYVYFWGKKFEQF